MDEYRMERFEDELADLIDKYRKDGLLSYDEIISVLEMRAVTIAEEAEVSEEDAA